LALVVTAQLPTQNSQIPAPNPQLPMEVDPHEPAKVAVRTSRLKLEGGSWGCRLFQQGAEWPK
jgi:hypothetical protein